MKTHKILRLIVLALIMSVIIHDEFRTFVAKHFGIVKVILGIYLSTFLFSVFSRWFILFRPFFESKLNILSTKVSYEKTIELDIDHTFLKTIEVLKENGFSIRKTNKSENWIFAIREVSFFSWGQNIYIDLASHDLNSTLLKISSVSVFNYATNEENEENFATISTELDKSLTI